MCHALWQAAMSEDPRFLKDLCDYPGFMAQVNDRCIHNQLAVFVALCKGHIINVMRLLADDRVDKDDLSDGLWLSGYEDNHRRETARIYRDASSYRARLMLLAGMGPRIFAHFKEISEPDNKDGEEVKFSHVQSQNLEALEKCMHARAERLQGVEHFDQLQKQVLRDFLKSLDENLATRWYKAKTCEIMEHLDAFLLLSVRSPQ